MRAYRGPDLAIVGAARSATSYLSGTVGRHAGVDPGAVKEPSYYSSRWERGPNWYDSLYESDSPGLIRMDASVSYTFPQHPEALDRLHAAAPGSTVVYVVRDPLLRAVSHYHLLHYYFRRDESTTFADAARRNPLYLGASDYATWLGALGERWPDERIVIVPFSLVREDVLEAARVVLAQVGLGPVGEDSVAVEFRNSLRSFRSKPFRLVSKALRHSHVYPRVRRLVGADGMRRINRMVTTEAATPSPAQELEGFAAETCERANALATRSWEAVAERLGQQDGRLGLDWAGRWAATPAARAQPHASLSPGEKQVMLPDLYLVGAAKAGTTSLAGWLAGHPDVFWSTPKEPYYWASDFPRMRAHYGFDTAEAYGRLYASAAARDAAVRGDGSTTYLYSTEAVPSILREVPHARFIVCLRSPVDLLVSYHRTQLVALNEDEPDFGTAWRRSLDGVLPGTDPLDPKLVDYPLMGRLGRALSRLLDLVPDERVHTVVFDEITSQPDKVCASLATFVGIDPRLGPAFTPRNASDKMFRSSRLRRWTHRPPAALQAPARGLRQWSRTTSTPGVAGLKRRCGAMSSGPPPGPPTWRLSLPTFARTSRCWRAFSAVISGTGRLPTRPRAGTEFDAGPARE